MTKNNTGTLNEYAVRKSKRRNSTEKLSFLSHISHGIRTPLNSIMGFSKLLVLRDIIDPKQKEYIQGILKGSNLLLQFVDNIMDLSQFEANNYSLRLESLDINKILWDFTEEFYNQRIENNDLDINLMLVWDNEVNDLVVETDPLLLKKALRRVINLVTVKYPVVEFELGYRKTKENKLSIFVRPSNEKLNEKDLLDTQQLFSVDTNDSFDYFNFQVLKRSILMLGGEISVDSINQEFSFTIPFINETK